MQRNHYNQHCTFILIVEMENCPFNMHILWYCIRLFIFYLFTWAVPDWLSCVIVLQPIL